VKIFFCIASFTPKLPRHDKSLGETKDHRRGHALDKSPEKKHLDSLEIFPQQQGTPTYRSPEGATD